MKSGEGKDSTSERKGNASCVTAIQIAEINSGSFLFQDSPFAPRSRLPKLRLTIVAGTHNGRKNTHTWNIAASKPDPSKHRPRKICCVGDAYINGPLIDQLGKQGIHCSASF